MNLFQGLEEDLLFAPVEETELDPIFSEPAFDAPEPANGPTANGIANPEQTVAAAPLQRDDDVSTGDDDGIFGGLDGDLVLAGLGDDASDREDGKAPYVHDSVRFGYDTTDGFNFGEGGVINLRENDLSGDGLTFTKVGASTVLVELPGENSITLTNYDPNTIDHAAIQLTDDQLNTSDFVI